MEHEVDVPKDGTDKTSIPRLRANEGAPDNGSTDADRVTTWFTLDSAVHHGRRR